MRNGISARRNGPVWTVSHKDTLSDCHRLLLIVATGPNKIESHVAQPPFLSQWVGPGKCVPSLPNDETADCLLLLRHSLALMLPLHGHGLQYWLP